MGSFTSQPQRVGAVFSGIIDPKKAEFNGITMRSRLEVDFARHLSRQGISWTYEPAIFGPKGRGYLPDFELHLGVRRCYVEVKPTVQQAIQATSRMEIIWRDFSDATLIVVSAQESRYYAAQSGSPWTWWVERWQHAA